MVSTGDFVKDMERRLKPSCHRDDDAIVVSTTPDVDYDVRLWYNAEEKVYKVDFWTELTKGPARLQQAVIYASGSINQDTIRTRQPSRLLGNTGFGKLDPLS